MEMIQDVQTIMELIQVQEQDGRVQRHCYGCIASWVVLRAEPDNESAEH